MKVISIQFEGYKGRIYEHHPTTGAIPAFIDNFNVSVIPRKGELISIRGEILKVDYVLHNIVYDKITVNLKMR